jgi:hypothetical protein
MQQAPAAPDPIRSMRIFNGMGDVEVEWTEEADERMHAVIQRKMDAGIRFFQITIKGAKAKRTRIKSVDELTKRRIYVADEDIEKAFCDGAVTFNRREGGEDIEITHVEDAAVAAKGQTLGMPQYSGG